MASTPEPQEPGLKIINASLFRMATKSMAQAYTTLGYKTHHGLLNPILSNPWTEIELAAKATWPSIINPNTTPLPPFTRQDWDKIWGTEYDAVTDLASPFALELIKAYPSAKVVIIQRDFNTWFPSFKEEVVDRVMLEPMGTVYGWIGWGVMGHRAVQAMRSVCMGFFHARDIEELERNARGRYEEYYSEIRRLVPEERRLEYRIGEGWDRLCGFLGRDVPVGVEFPRGNDRGEHGGVMEGTKRRFLWRVGGRVLPWVVVGGAVVWWYFYS